MNNEYKMIVMDMDYTLLNDNKEITERNMQALQQAAAKGVKLVVATGRIFASAKHFAKLISTDMPIIASNGAIIRDENRNITLAKNILPDEIILSILEIAKKYNISCHIFSDDTIYVEKDSETCRKYGIWNNSIIDENNKVNIIMDVDLKTIVKMQKGKLIKIIAMDDIEKIIPFREEVARTHDVSISRSLKNNIEIMSKGVSKGNAVEFIAKGYGIKREEVICIGDNENDLSMIRYAGLGVVMGNAEEDIKAEADYITASCEDSGVAEVIEKFILNN